MDTAEAPTSRDERDLLGVFAYDGISEVGANKDMDSYPEMARLAPDSARGLTVALDKIGLHALNWFDRRARG
jgi:hypothetical protein